MHAAPQRTTPAARRLRDQLAPAPLRGRTRGPLVAAALVVGLAAPGPAHAAAESPAYEPRVLPCPKHSTDLNRTYGSAVWVRGDALYGCAAGVAGTGDPNLDEPPSRPRKLGPWSRGSRVTANAIGATWAHRTRGADGAPVDRIYAADLRTGAWLRGAEPGMGPADRRVSKLEIGQNIVAWTTTLGTVMAAAEGGAQAGPEPDRFDLDLVGAGTAASPPGRPEGEGLVQALRPQAKRLLVGRWPEAAAQVAQTFRLKALSDADMENEPCIGSLRWAITTQPVVGAPRVGAKWRAHYFPTEAYCR